MAQAAKQVALFGRETLVNLGTGKKPFPPGRRKIAHVKECFHHRLFAFRRQVIISRKKSARFLPLGGGKAFKDFLPLAHLLFLFRRQTVPFLQISLYPLLLIGGQAPEVFVICHHALLVFRRQFAQTLEKTGRMGMLVTAP